MTKEDKELLLRDLCCRLPYNVKVSHDRIPPPGWMIKNTWIDGYLDSIEPDWSKDNGYNPHIICSGTECGIADVKPYLRPMSSMTLDEQCKYNEIQAMQHWVADDGKVGDYAEALDYLNEHHFDYRGLIEKGLALEAPDEMYKKEDKV